MFDSESANGRNEDDTLFVQFKHMPCNGLDTVNQDRPLPLVIAGPSGVGKGTIIKNIMDRYPNAFGFSVSHTTRAPRAQEVPGQHYHFVPEDVMERGISSGDFVEHAHVHGAYYGTSHTEIQGVMNDGKICILDIDVQGVATVKQHPTLTCKHVFIMPPSIQVLEERLRGRKTENEEKIQKRLGNAQKEIDFAQSPDKPFDAIIVNNDIERATDELLGLLKQWHPEFKWE